MTLNEKLKIPAVAWVVVADGRKALVLRNQGDEVFPNLQVQQVYEAPPNPATREQGSDKPPRAIYGGRRSAIEQTDWHELAERRFAEEVAAVLERMHRDAPLGTLIIVAPPRALADLRKALSDEIKRTIVAEIDKDLTKHPVYEIESHLTDA
jgi:protein required for attachment to host cells